MASLKITDVLLSLSLVCYSKDGSVLWGFQAQAATEGEKYFFLTQFVFPSKLNGSVSNTSLSTGLYLTGLIKVTTQQLKN